jgi:hypothetical protein
MIKANRRPWRSSPMPEFGSFEDQCFLTDWWFSMAEYCQAPQARPALEK